MLLSSYGMMSKRPNVVRSLVWDPGYHEEIRNGPENKIHIRKSNSGVREWFRCFYQNVLEGSRRFTGLEGEWFMNVSWLSGMIGSCPRSLWLGILKREIKL